MVETLFLILGIVVGLLGTLIGTGGGFILVPILIFLFPEKTPAQVTAISLFAVLCNCVSGSVVYCLRGQVHIKSAIYFALAGIPGAWLGAQLTSTASMKSFGLIFGTFMIGLATYLLLKKRKAGEPTEKFELHSKQIWFGTLISFGIGFIASFLGIGGGVIHVPLMSEVIGFPVHMATGTSHAILSVTSLIASIQHWKSGNLDLTELPTLLVAGGMVVGAQIGARLSKKIHGHSIMRILGLCLMFVGGRLIYNSLI